MKTTTLQLDAPWKISFLQDDIEIGKLPSQNIAAETVYSAMSIGTEIAAFMGLSPLRRSVTYPRLLGYCNVAKIVSVGHDVKNLQVGDHILTHQSHRSAFSCPTNDVLVKIPGGLDLKTASLCYLYQLGYAALLRGKFTKGKKTGIIGMGVLGRTTAELAGLLGGTVTCFTNQNSIEGFETLRKDHTDLQSDLDIIITTSNSWSDWELALKAVGSGGTIVALGFPGRGEALPSFNPLEPAYFYDKQLTLMACGPTSEHEVKLGCEYLMSLIQERKLTPNKLIAGVVPWFDLQDIYKKISTRSSVSGTYVIDWQVKKANA